MENDDAEKSDLHLEPDSATLQDDNKTVQAKVDHLIPLSRRYDSDSDLDIEIIKKKSKLIMIENQIANSVVDNRKRMLQLAAEQKERRRIEELEERRKEIEELKRKRQERREARKLEEQQRKALELENKNLEESNQIERENEDDDTNSHPKVHGPIDSEHPENTQEVESHIQLEYDNESEISLRLDSGSDIESAKPIPHQMATLPSRNEEHPLSGAGDGHCEKVETEVVLKLDEPENIMDLLSGRFAETQHPKEDIDIPMESSRLDSKKLSSNPEPTQQSVSGVLDLLSGAFPPTQDENEDNSGFELHLEPQSLPADEDVASNGIDQTKNETMITKTQNGNSPLEAESHERYSNLSVQDELSIQDILDMDNDSESSPELNDDENIEPQEMEEEGKLVVKWSVVENVNAKIQNSGPRFVETEAAVEEDEFMNFGGADGEEIDGQNEYDKSLLADSDEDIGDIKAVMELHHQKLADEDQNMVNNIINDVTSGAYRKRKSLREGGMGLDLYDSDEETEAILKRIRQKMGLNYNSKTGEGVFDTNSLEILASNPKTKAFAEVFQVKEEETKGFLSSSDEESKIETFKTRIRTTTSKRKMYRSNSNSDLSQSVIYI
jgi:hypothetical protein